MAPASTLLLHALDPYLLFLAEPIGSCCNFTIQVLQFLLLPLQSNLQLEMLILLVLQHQLRPYLYTLLLYYAALEVLDRWAKARDIPETRAQKRDVCRVGISLLQLGVEVGSGGVGFRGVKEAAKLGEDAFEELGLYLWREVGVGDRIERLSQISQLLHFHGKHYKIIRQKLLRSSIFTPSKDLKNNKTSPFIHIHSNCVIFILYDRPKQS